MRHFSSGLQRVHLGCGTRPGGKDDMRGSLFGKRLGQAPQLAKGKGGEKGKRNEKGPRPLLVSKFMKSMILFCGYQMLHKGSHVPQITNESTGSN